METSNIATKYVWEELVYGQLYKGQQDPIWHAEGDVGTHTRMVVQSLLNHPGYVAASPETQDVLMRAALLHDLGKPLCTQVEDGRIRNRGHSRKGATLSRALLYGEGYDPRLRERVCALIRAHGLPVHQSATADDKLTRKVIYQSHILSNKELAVLAEVDLQGRTSKAPMEALFQNIGNYVALAESLQCLDSPFKFASAAAKFDYFRKESGDPKSVPDSASSTTEMVMVCGLPGSGKDTWVKHNCPDKPVISLDAIHAGLQAQGKSRMLDAVAEAKRQAEAYLKAQVPFVFNAPNTNPEWRLPWISLAASYNATIRIVYLEVPLKVLLSRATNPARVYSALEAWSVPHPSEGHIVEYHYNEVA